MKRIVKFGLSEQEARLKLEEVGPNELPDERRNTLFDFILSSVKEPMVLMLISIGVIYVLLGEVEESLSLLSFLILILWITIYQERKTEHTLTALKKLSSPRALVIRDGVRRRIGARELVPEDLVIVSEGDRVPADIKLIEGGPLSIDESAMTGESVPVEKIAGSSENQMYSGTLILRGQGLGEVTATGLNSELGKIGISLTEVTGPSRLQADSRKTVNRLFVVAAILTLFVFLYYGFTRHQWLEAMLVSLTLAMAILPNEIPAVLMIFLATGAWRISKKQVLTRKVAALESLGSITALCVDKTGTLTLNQMLIQSLYSGDKEFDVLESDFSSLPEEFHEVLEYGILASKPEPFDPMEKSFHLAGEKYLQHTEHLHPEWTILKEYPITDDLLAVSYAWKSRDKNSFLIGAKGAPEAIVDLCHLDEKTSQKIASQVSIMAEKGLRVLGVAKSQSPTLPQIQHDLDFEFIGLVGLADPLRSDAPKAVKECHEAGIKVMMITGDHPATAKSIGKKVGLENPDETITGDELHSLTDEEVIDRLKNVRIFCRMKPFHKNRIVELLKKSGEIVAMTGDGVNDVLALKKADVGIAMGGRGTDVAREASSIVLIDDNFSSIVEAIKNGRRTFHNLQRAFSYLISVHIPITAVSVVPVVFKLPLLLLPVHIAFLHLIIEPVSTIYYEAEPGGKELMQTPPRKVGTPILGKEIIFLGVLKGIWVSAVVLGIFIFTLWKGHSHPDARGLTFSTLILSNLTLIFMSGKTHRKKQLMLMASGTIILLCLIIYVPILRHLFRFEILHPLDLALCGTAGLLTAIGLAVIDKLKRGP